VRERTFSDDHPLRSTERQTQLQQNPFTEHHALHLFRCSVVGDFGSPCGANPASPPRGALSESSRRGWSRVRNSSSEVHDGTSRLSSGTNSGTAASRVSTRGGTRNQEMYGFGAFATLPVTLFFGARP
jgi:hypothetical protein